MITADFVLIIIALLAVLCGLVMGFGKTLKLVTRGVIGKIISVVVCYFLFGIVLNMGFVQNLLDKLITALSDNGSGICTLLIKIRIDLIVLAIALFIIVQILRKVLVSLIGDLFEIDKKPVKVINKILGVVLMFAVNAIIILVVMQILAWITGVDGSVYEFLSGSKLGLDKLFLNNPLNSVFENIRLYISELV